MFREKELIGQINLAEQITAKKIFIGLENIFLKNQGDAVPNFHTVLIRDYNKFKAKFLKENENV